MRVVVLQSNYIPWKGYFELVKDAEVFCFYDEVQYTKNDWRNRNQLSGANGAFWLTIPIGEEAVKQKISEVELKKKEWQAKHFNTIEQTYKKAPYYKDVLPLLEEFYLNRTWDKLSEANQFFIKTISEYIGLDTRIDNSVNYILSEGKVERLLNLLKQLGCTEYISGPSGRDYLKDYEPIFTEQNINIIYKKYGNYKKYDHRYNYLDGVSILDVLCNVGQAELKDHITSNVELNNVI